MIINRIKLHNFGSYEDTNIFNFKTNKDRNIVLIGGKNGTGKTTLFTAIRIAIYGYNAFGYQSINSFYNKSIIKLINNNAKLKEPSKAYVEIDFKICNGPNIDNYIINRSWQLKNNNINERIKIIKNNEDMDDEEIANFEKYIMQIIPPDLFDLYFFDGEKIADFFLNEGAKVRLKNAFLTLCGYDIFDLMNKNFKRILSSSSVNNPAVENYMDLKSQLGNKVDELEKLRNKIELNKKNVDEIDAKLRTLEKEYRDSGGVSQEEWNKKVQSIRDEEHFRDIKNHWLKKTANDYIPFLMLKKELKNLKVLIKTEDELRKYEAFNELLKNSVIQELFRNKLKSDNMPKTLSEVGAEIESKFLNKECLLNLSIEQQGQLLSQINEIEKFNEKEIFKTVQDIKNSIKKVQKIRDEIQKCNIDKIKDYIELKTKYLEEENSILNLSLQLGGDLQKLEAECNSIRIKFEKCKKEYEQELKRSSVNDISTKAILMLDTLTKELYQIQIDKVEETFKSEIDKLMCKKNFISEIKIDSEFNIKLYGKESYNKHKISSLLKKIGVAGIEKTLGKRALEQIRANKANDCIIDIELDRTLFSNGEKQIFIMALYKSLMSLCRYRVPFVIDTPFARIDTEHRNNISQHFFRELNGQVFILSTNEEIEDKQLDMLKDKLGTTFMLENSDNKRTIIKENIYFSEVTNVI